MLLLSLAPGLAIFAAGMVVGALVARLIGSRGGPETDLKLAERLRREMPVDGPHSPGR